MTSETPCRLLSCSKITKKMKGKPFRNDNNQFKKGKKLTYILILSKEILYFQSSKIMICIDTLSQKNENIHL